MLPFIAKDTKQPLVVLGGYRIGQGGAIMPDYVPALRPGQDYGCDPVGDGTFRMVPSGDIVSGEEKESRLRK